MKRAKNEAAPVVLVVDDEVDIREPLAFRLRYAGFTVREASDGHEAFEILAQHGIDAVFSDVRMSVCDGITLLKRMRTELGSKIPFAFVTADGRQQANHLLQARSQAVFTKPIDAEALIDWLKASVEDSRLAAIASGGVRPEGATRDRTYAKNQLYVSVTPLDTQRVPMESERFVARVREAESTLLRLSIAPRSLPVGTVMRINMRGEHSDVVHAMADARLLRATSASQGAEETLELAFACETSGAGNPRALLDTIASHLYPLQQDIAS